MSKFSGIILGALLLLVGCGEEQMGVNTTELPDHREKITVMLSCSDNGSIALDESTRTTLADDGTTICWDTLDVIKLWGHNAAGDPVVDGAELALWRYNPTFSEGCFRGTVSAMDDGTYSYYAATPVPASVAGTQLFYNIPAVQDGEYHSDWNILLSEPVTDAPALVKGYNEAVPLSFKSQIHLLRIRIPANNLGEKITSMTLSFTSPVVGSLMIDYTDATLELLSSTASDTVTLKFNEPKDAGDEVYAFIAPVESTTLSVISTGTVYESEPRTVSGKLFSAGHTTPISYTVPVQGRILGTMLRFTLDAGKTGLNTLGEKANSFTLSVDGAQFNNGSSTSEVFQINDSGVYEMFFPSSGGINASALSGKQITVTYDSEHALVPATFTLPTIADGTVSSHVLPEVPYLFFEDFSTVAYFSNKDAYATSSTGNNHSITFLDGWSGGRVGAQANTAIRLAARRETSARYHARVDSAPLKNIKSGKTVNISVEFQYGMDRQEGGIGSANVGQTCYMGYVTETTTYASGDTDGTFNDSFNIKETGYGYTNMPYVRTFTLSGRGPETRLSWRTECDNKAGLNNSTCWLYMDNIKVKIIN